MIQVQSYLTVADNSGAKQILCIGVLSNKSRIARVGDIIKATIKKVAPKANIKRSEVVFALVVRTRRNISRTDGTYMKFVDNAAILLNSDKKSMRGTRIFGPIAKEIREHGFSKISNIAQYLL